MKYFLLAAIAAALTGCGGISSQQNRLAQEASDQREAQYARLRAQANDKRERSNADIKQAMEALASCVKQQALSLALMPEPTDTLSRAAVVGCSGARADYSAAVLRGGFVTFEQRESLIHGFEDELRDMAIRLIVDRRARAREQAPPNSSTPLP